MAYTICLIDDAFPTAETVFIDTVLLDRNTLRYLSEKIADWSDSNLKSLCSSLLSAEDDWEPGAFKHPEFYLKHIKNTGYRPDFIVYDWEYAGIASGKTSEKFLLEILEQSFALVYVYTAQDSEQKISNILDGAEFAKYRDKRLFILSKTTTNSAATLKTAADNAKDNFSFRFGAELRKNALSALEKILVKLGTATGSDVSKFLNPDEGTSDLVDFLAERFRSEIRSLTFAATPTAPATATSPVTDEAIAELWAYRLYSDSNDGLVRRGDIATDSAGNPCLVISGDCDLDRFWENKTHGYVNFVPLLKLDANIFAAFRNFFSLAGTIQNTVYTDKLFFSSIANFINIEGKAKKLAQGTFILPFIRIGTGVFNYIGYSKNLCSVQIPRPTAPIQPQSLKYSEWSGHTRICTISEPFLTPLVNSIIHSLSGTGAPDYGSDTENAIKRISNKLS